MKRLASICGACALLLPGFARAAPDPQLGEVPAASIYEIHPVADGAVIAGGALATALPYLFTSRLIEPHCPCSAGSVNSFDRGVIGNASAVADWTSTVVVGLAIAVPPLADGLLVRDGRVLAQDLTVLAEAIAVNSVLVTLAKFTTKRPLPRVYANPSLAGSPSNYRSFYSGHTSLTMAVLSVASGTADRRYHLTWQPWAVAVAVSGGVAAERILAGSHFYTDVLAGAAAGLVVGTAVSWVHLRDRGLHLSATHARDGTMLLVQGAF